jgi:NitT/TauT family transport system permease protein
MQDTLPLSSTLNTQASKKRRLGSPLASANLWLWLTAPLAVGAFLLLWQSMVWFGDYPAFILPAPADVGATFIRVAANGTLWHHAQVTLLQVLAGLALGLSTATVLGYALAKSPLLERVLGPYIVASQAVPIVAIAPLLIIWLGSGYLSKILICTLIVFFPILINTIVGLRSVDRELYDLMRSMQASRWQIFTMLELPAALPILLGGLKVGVTLSVIGAVVGEFVGAKAGLGFLINQARGLFDTPLVFVAIFSLVFIALSLYGTVSLLEKSLLRWRT